MTRIPFSERLQQDKPLLTDGAMGTQLMDQHALPLNTCFDELNLTHPDMIRAIHRSYIEAGADIIETNSFSANRYRLAEYGLADQVVALNQAAVELARAEAEAAERDVYVAGAIGPMGLRLYPYGKVTRPDARNAFAEQAQALLDAGVDLILLETFVNLDELLLVIETVRSLDADMPIIAQATFTPDNVTGLGQNPARVASDLYRSGATVIGANCGTGPAQIVQVLQAMHQSVPEGRFSAIPNAGFPQTIGGRALYPATAEYFGDYASILTSHGAQIVGGCCGTTPEHIAAMRDAIDHPGKSRDLIPNIEIVEEERPAAIAVPTDLSQRLAQGQFTITVEITPPRGHNPQRLIEQGRLLRDAGAHLLDIADTPAAKMKMSAWAVSHVLQDAIGIETILHFPTRGRNILRVQGDLLAAHALGLRNLFVTMGDPARIGDYPEATDSYDIAPSELIGVIKKQMNAGEDMSGNSIGSPTNFTVGCALNMGADDLEREIKVLGRKLEGGADFALGQPVFDPPRLDRFFETYEEATGEPFTLPVIMGVIPLYSLKHARFLHNEVPGISIPDSIFERLEKAGDDVANEGVRIAIELMDQMRDQVQGAYIIPSFGRYHLAAEVVAALAQEPVIPA